MSPKPAARLVILYYVATPLFALLDLGGGVNLRLAGLEGHTVLRVVYYLLCAACAGVAWRRPRWAPVIGLAEGTLTITLLILGVMLPIVTLPSTIDTEGAVRLAAQLPEAVANLVLSGAVWIVSLIRNPLLSASRHPG